MPRGDENADHDPARGRLVAERPVRSLPVHRAQPIWRAEGPLRRPPRRAQQPPIASRLILTRAASGAATTNLIEFAGRIVALADGAIAQELASNLEASPVDAAGRHLGVGAYPKMDPLTGELHLISSPGETTALHHVLSAGGMTRRTHPIDDAPAPVLDLAITTRPSGSPRRRLHRGDRPQPQRTHRVASRRGRLDPVASSMRTTTTATSCSCTSSANGSSGGPPSAAVWTHEILDATPQQTSRLNEQVTGSRSPVPVRRRWRPTHNVPQRTRRSSSTI